MELNGKIRSILQIFCLALLKLCLVPSEAARLVGELGVQYFLLCICCVYVVLFITVLPLVRVLYKLFVMLEELKDS